MTEKLKGDFEGASVDAYLLRDGRPHAAVVICPGGGYSHVAPRESGPVARAFNGAGFHAFVLTYACDPRPLGYLPLRQLGAAVARVRRDAGALGVDAGRIAVCGFSAGGHLAASLGVFWKRDDLFGPATTAEERRPDALILSYPVISSGEYAHRGSFEQLAGPDRSAQDAFSLERFVSGDTPSSFLWHTVADRSVPIQNSLLFFGALMAQGIPCEFHAYPFGVHGLSLATPEVNEPEKNRLPDSHVATWFGLAAQWLSGPAWEGRKNVS